MKFLFFNEQFYLYYANCMQILKKIERPYVQIYTEIAGVQFAIPLRSGIEHQEHVLWTDKSNKCGLDFSKAVVIEDEKYIDDTKKPYIRPLEYKSLIGKEHIIKMKMIKHIIAYKKAKTMLNVQRNEFLCRFSTMQYFERYIQDIELNTHQFFTEGNLKNMKTITGSIEMEQGGVMTFELYPHIAPLSVENFVKLVKDGFYNGLTFHRIVPRFVIQGGDPDGNGTGGPGWSIKGEFQSNGVKNDLKHTKGVLSWARSADPDSAGSQFFIMVGDAPHLDGDYAAFGKVVSGIEVADDIVEGKHGKKPVMKSVVIDE